MSKDSLRHKAENDAFLNEVQVASGTECTGLMPAMIYTEDEGKNLSKLEGIHKIQPQNKQK